MRIKIAFAFIVFQLLLGSHELTLAQVGLGGVDAVMTVPTAEILEDGHVVVGFGYIPKPHGLWLAPDHDNLPYFATFGFLPFLEISFRATKALKRDEGSIGDRMASVRIQLFRETPSRPAITIGVHDIAGLVRSANRHFYSLYGVATKSIDILPHVSIKPTVGYGVDWPKAELMKEFNGLFGGVSLGYRDFFFLKAEYNDLLNVGLGIDLLNFLAVNLILIDGKDLGVGANFKKRL